MSCGFIGIAYIFVQRASEKREGGVSQYLALHLGSARLPELGSRIPRSLFVDFRPDDPPRGSGVIDCLLHGAPASVAQTAGAHSAYLEPTAFFFTDRSRPDNSGSGDFVSRRHSAQIG